MKSFICAPVFRYTWDFRSFRKFQLFSKSIELDWIVLFVCSDVRASRFSITRFMFFNPKFRISFVHNNFNDFIFFNAMRVIMTRSWISIGSKFKIVVIRDFWSLSNVSYKYVKPQPQPQPQTQPQVQPQARKKSTIFFEFLDYHFFS